MKREITAVLYIPENENVKRRFEKRICDCYCAQIEHRVSALTKEEKLEILDIVIDEYAPNKKKTASFCPHDAAAIKRCGK